MNRVSNEYTVSMPKKARGKKGFPGGRVVKSPAANAGDTRDMNSAPQPGKMPWRKKGTTPAVFSGKFHGQRSLADYIVHEVRRSRT